MPTEQHGLVFVNYNTVVSCNKQSQRLEWRCAKTGLALITMYSCTVSKSKENVYFIILDNERNNN